MQISVQITDNAWKGIIWADSQKPLKPKEYYTLFGFGYNEFKAVYNPPFTTCIGYVKMRLKQWEFINVEQKENSILYHFKKS